LSDAVAAHAQRSTACNIRAACEGPADRTARGAMMVGAHHGGLAFSNSSVALVHGMSRPIGAFFHVPHGLSNAMLLPAVTRFSAPAALPRYADCARAMGVAQEHEGDQSAVARLIDALEQLNADLDVPSPRSHGISEETYRNLIPTMAAQAIASGSPGNNPREATAEEIGQLYLEAYG